MRRRSCCSGWGATTRGRGHDDTHSARLAGRCGGHRGLAAAGVGARAVCRLRPRPRGLDGAAAQACPAAARRTGHAGGLCRLPGRPRSAEGLPRQPLGGDARGLRRLEEGRAPGLPDQRLQRLHGGADPHEVPRPEVDQGPGAASRQPVEAEVDRAAGRQGLARRHRARHVEEARRLRRPARALRPQLRQHRLPGAATRHSWPCGSMRRWTSRRCAS